MSELLLISLIIKNQKKNKRRNWHKKIKVKKLFPSPKKDEAKNRKVIKKIMKMMMKWKMLVMILMLIALI